MLVYLDVEMHEFGGCSRQPLMSTQTSETKSEGKFNIKSIKFINNSSPNSDNRDY